MARTPRQPDAPNQNAQTYSPLAGQAPIAFDRTPAGQTSAGSRDSPYADEAGNYLPGVVSGLAGPDTGETPQQVWLRERSRQRAIADANQTPWYREGGSSMDTNAPLAPGAAAGAAGPQVADTALDQSGRDAFVRLQAVLDQYGLGSLKDWAKTALVQGLSEAEVGQQLREQEAYKKRFSVIEERRKKGLAPMSPAEILAYEKQAAQLMRAAGLPAGFYDTPDDFNRYMVNDKSLSELSDNITQASRAVYNTDPQTLAELSRFGMTGGDMVAFWLNPDIATPLLERKYEAARLSATANRTGFGSLSEDEATGLRQIGVTDQAAQQGFGMLADSQELFGSLDAGEDTISREQQIDAAFRGSSSAKRRIEQRARRRQAQFQGGGQFAAGQTGVVGLGSGPRV